VTVQVFNLGPDGIAENGDDMLVGEAVTDANGNYFIDGLLPGDYYVSIPNIDDAFPVSSTGESLDPNDDTDNDDNGIQVAPGEGVWSNVITLTGDDEPTGEGAPGGNQDAADDNNGNMTVDFGFFAPASVGDFVFKNCDEFGVQNGSETGLEDAVVSISLADGTSVNDINGNAVAAITTGADGAYMFTDLFPGDYKVTVELPAEPTGLAFAAMDAADDDIDSDINPGSGMTDVFTLVSGDVSVSDNCGIADVSAVPGPIEGDCEFTQDFEVTVTDDCGNTATCTVSFAWIESELEVVCPDPLTVDECLTQDEINALFADWLGTFDAINGCNPTTSSLDFTAPDVCEGGTVTVVFSATDACNSDECTSTFTVPARPDLELAAPADQTVDGCMTQDDIDAAFAAWLDGVNFGGGCDPVLEVSNESAPEACEGGSVTVTFTLSDDCQ